MVRNKNRLYLALSHHPPGGVQGHHHQSLLFLPKTLDLSCPGQLDAWRFRAVRDEGSDRWGYRGAPAPARTTMLGALVLLGKTTLSGEELNEMLQAVPLRDIDNCTVWTNEAIQVCTSVHLLSMDC
jgi:hypothetical protein